MNSTRFSIKSRINSFKYAVNGLWALIRYEHNSRIHLLAAVAAIALGIVLKLNLVEWSLLVIVIGVVFITELINSSIESLSDLIDPERNERIRKAKDYSAAAVLFSAIISLIAGGFIFIPKVMGLIK